jgi:hypothetical protein
VSGGAEASSGRRCVPFSFLCFLPSKEGQSILYNGEPCTHTPDHSQTRRPCCSPSSRPRSPGHLSSASSVRKFSSLLQSHLPRTSPFHSILLSRVHSISCRLPQAPLFLELVKLLSDPSSYTKYRATSGLGANGVPALLESLLSSGRFYQSLRELMSAIVSSLLSALYPDSLTILSP